MSTPLVIRPVQAPDRDQWLPLWQGDNAFYGRAGATALAEQISQTMWQRFVDAGEPVHALVAARGEHLVGLTHDLFHRSTTQLGATCCLQDLYTVEAVRGQGVGRALIRAVGERAQGPTPC